MCVILLKLSLRMKKELSGFGMKKIDYNGKKKKKKKKKMTITLSRLDPTAPPGGCLNSMFTTNKLSPHSHVLK